ncbi:MAG: HAD-IIIA family hydrolase [Chitinophagaceae bacterium]
MIREAIILAGGLGTRLRDAVPDLPKCMAPVAGRPFLFHVINYLRMQGIERFIFSLGYKHEVIGAWLAEQFERMDYTCVVEDEPLGTGGAIRLALEKLEGENAVVTNGDTLFKAAINELEALHTATKAGCTLALRPMENFDRYGAVETDADHLVTAFREKQFYPLGLINGGVYVLNKAWMGSLGLPSKFSFEKDVLEKQVPAATIAGLPQDGYFIDIGIPEDYNKAQTDLQRPPLDLAAIDQSWTLFLDRDGVINEDKPGSYIFNTGEFVFMTGAPELFKILHEKFGRIIVVTNQRGVGRGLMTEEDLAAIHQTMVHQVQAAGGSIDAIYYCTAVHNEHPERKPNPGMAARAIHDFPAIDPARSIMVGNNISDMQFGRNAGLYTVFVRTTLPGMQLPHPDIDRMFDTLAGFTKALSAP